MTKKRWGQALIVAYVLLLALTLTLIVKFGAAREPEVQKIGFITVGGMDGQAASAYRGVSAACESLGVNLLARDNVGEYSGACPQAVAELAEEGAEMIILSSPGYAQELEPLFSRYPSVTFYGIFASASSYDVNNLTSYSARMYQARYLSGIVAGTYTQSGRIGFVATEATSEVCRNINAFALGVRRVNPEAEVIVVWAGTDTQSETRAAWALVQNERTDVLTYHQDQHTVVDVAEAAGAASIGYYEEAEGVSDRYLTCAACDWEIIYEQIIREYLRGQSENVVGDWLGLESGAVGLTEYSPLVSQAAIDEVEQASQDILSGWDVFTNEIYDNEGSLRCGQGESMTDETLLRRMDWLVEGVRVYEQAE